MRSFESSVDFVLRLGYIQVELLELNNRFSPLALAIGLHNSPRYSQI